VIPAIGAPLMARGWLRDIRTWVAPDRTDDGVALLADTLRELGGDRIGLPDGLETHVHMPLASLRAVERLIAPAELVGDAGIMARLRAVKSPAEVDRIETACAIAGRAFGRVGEVAAVGVPLSQVFRGFQRLLLDEGADWVSYVAGAAGPLGYDDVISPATEAPLAQGDVLMLDTGAVWGGYFCDYDRNFAIGPVAPVVQDAHKRLIAATHVGFAACRPGATATEIYHTLNRALGDPPYAGRLGHGLGMQLTEGMSLIPSDHTVLEPGMVLTLEPGLATDRGRMLVHEENVLITETGARWLTPVADETLPIF
jgi:Xaa-Pro aminopeptidase